MKIACFFTDLKYVERGTITGAVIMIATTDNKDQQR